MTPCAYSLWTPDGGGEAERDMLAMQLNGLRPVQVDGEAYAMANENWQTTRDRLHRIACECGYIVTGDSDKSTISVCTHEGAWRLYFSDEGLMRVRRVLVRGHDETEYDQWHRSGILDPDGAWRRH